MKINETVYPYFLLEVCRSSASSQSTCLSITRLSLRNSASRCMLCSSGSIHSSFGCALPWAGTLGIPGFSVTTYSSIISSTSGKNRFGSFVFCTVFIQVYRNLSSVSLFSKRGLKSTRAVRKVRTWIKNREFLTLYLNAFIWLKYTFQWVYSLTYYHPPTKFMLR